MKITLSSVIRVEEPTGRLLAWAKETLTLPNPDYLKKSRMGKWTGNTPREIRLYSMDGDALILPFGTARSVWGFVGDEDTVISAFPQKHEILYGGAEVPLYDYQREAVGHCLIAKYGILQSAAGSGKTQMGIALAKQLGRRTLWLTHTLDLLRQSKERAERYIPEDLIGTIESGRVNVGKGITFATVQTMARMDLSPWRDTWDVIIVDECHRVTGTPTAVSQFSKVLGQLKARHRFGLSATVHRADGMIAATKALLGDVIYQVPDSAVADKVMKVKVLPVGTGTGITPDCLGPDGMVQYSRLINHMCEDEDRCRLIVDTITENRNHSCLILSDRVGHLQRLMSLLPVDMRRNAVMVDGSMTTKAAKQYRAQAIEDMRTGRMRYLFATYSLAKEGLDVPRLSRLFLTTPQKDYAVITQSIGRVARTFDGKPDPVVIDFVDSSRMMQKMYKQRCTVYRKNKCELVEEA